MKDTRLREHGASILVAALGSTFGVVLLGVVDVLDQSARVEHVATSGSAGGTLILRVMAIAFLTLSLYVGGIVTANTFATIVSGRVRDIALLRLLGASARSQRAAVVRESLLVGVIGALVGGGFGLVLETVAVRVLVARHLVPDLPFRYVSWTMILPLVAVVVSTVVAGRVGSRGVLRVSPIQATSSSQEATFEEASRRTGRHVLAGILLVIGTALLAIGVVVGLSDPNGVLIGLLGGIASFSGIIAAADVVMPLCLSLVGRLFGSGPSTRLARSNATRHPDRSARATIGMVIGVSLVTTFAVALTTLQSQVVAAGGDDAEFGSVTVVFTCLTGFAGVIAAVGMVNNLSLGVLQRRRELGMLRVLGFTRGQVRLTVLAEAAQTAVTSIVLGLCLGVVFGWCGAQAALGSISRALVAPVVPLPLVTGLACAAILLAAVSSLAPSRRATRANPVESIRTL